MLAPCSWISSLQNCEKINLYCSRLSACDICFGSPGRWMQGSRRGKLVLSLLEVITGVHKSLLAWSKQTMFLHRSLFLRWHLPQKFSHVHLSHVTRMELVRKRAGKAWLMKVSSNLRDCPRGSVVKNPPAHARDMGSVPGSGRPPGEGNGNPLQYSCLGNPMDGGAWWATVHGLTKSWTWLSNWAAISNLNSLEMNYLHVSRQKRTHTFFPESRKVTIEFPQLWPQ